MKPNTYYEISVKGKAFLLIGTSRVSEWSNGKAFTILIENNISAFEDWGFGDMYANAQSLDVGEQLESDFPEEGVALIRVQ